MLLHVISKADLFNAYNVLFGSYNKISMDFLRYLQPSVLKEAYRQRALETHPDRSKVLGESKTEMSERFIEATLAYEKLCSALKGDQIDILAGEIGVKGKSRQSPERPNKNKNLSDHFYKGCLPTRRLLIGQYLYYSGFISWRTLINAITWQKRQRPPIGEIALKWGMLSPYDIKRILTERSKEQRHEEKFGQYAWRKGYITPFELMALLGKQRRIQRPIGEYFIEQGILDAQEINKMVEKLRIHNG